MATGVAPDAAPPLEWSEDKNIRWKTELPGLGHSTPIVWGDRIFLTTAIPYGEALKPRYSGRPGAHDNLPISKRHQFDVMAINRESGMIVWQKTMNKRLPHEGAHESASLASNSPVTDGERVFAFFGSHGLYCLDFDGDLIWEANFGDMHTKHGHGEGSTPVLFGETLVVNWDHEGQSFVVALDKHTGKERWKANRDEATSWSSPIVIESDGKPLVIVPGTNRVRAYDLGTGKVIWQCGGLSHNICASPVYADEMLYVGSSYEIRSLLAIRTKDAVGDLTDTDHVAWRRVRGTPYVPSPLLYDGALYFLAHYQAVMTRVQAKTGEEQPGPFRLSGIGNVYASPVGAAGRVYITDLGGTTLVISNGDIPRALALNKLNDSFSASATIVDKEFFLRGKRHLYCIVEQE